MTQEFADRRSEETFLASSWTPASASAESKPICGNNVGSTRLSESDSQDSDISFPHIQFIYVVAVEGAGHHGLVAVLQRALESAGSDFAFVRVRWSTIRKAFAEVERMTRQEYVLYLLTY